MAISLDLLLFCTVAVQIASTSFYGGSMTFFPGERHQDGTLEVSVYYRESSNKSCGGQLNWDCLHGDCGNLLNSEAFVTDQGNSDLFPWCQSEGHMARILVNDSPFILGSSGCCWDINATGWRLDTLVDMGTRSDTQLPNSSPITATVPKLRIPQNCFSNVSLLAYDPNGDDVRCRFASDAGVNCSFCSHPDISLDQDLCSLNAINPLALGVHVFEMVLEDFPTKDINSTYRDGSSVVKHSPKQTADPTPLSRIPLQFAVEMLSPVENCTSGEVQPRFLTPTPSHGDIQKATVGQVLVITLRAQFAHSPILDFQVSGPWNMSKTTVNQSSTIAIATIRWTPQESDTGRSVPICFTADALTSQSEMRCIQVSVNQSPMPEQSMTGEGAVSCKGNLINIVLSKASLQGVDLNWLHLNDPSCSLTANDTHIMGTVSLNTCGTVIEDSGDFIVFKNEINTFEVASAVISRRSHIKIGFSCQYPKEANAISRYMIPDFNYVFTESSFGSFGYSFDIFTDQTFETVVGPSNYPVKTKLLEKIYMGIESHSSFPNTQLFVESCRGTPDGNPQNPVFYDFLQNGCLLDETMMEHSDNPNKYYFEIEAFRFSGDQNQVFISCSVILCAQDEPNSRCSLGCLQSPYRRKRDVAMETGVHYLTQGPIVVGESN
ncbi:uncharacterized protein LOC114765544 isoform X2 [Denticeps clupeoides]|uniref:uncharacterized protein LOC114765544 isoform X2 n=1 Tax=Denticeps clupeoides TaxID=299321 RepID=UPI0010A2CCE5|nr:uncharacterized protein LOC114765544 isoform X2 [Denticeps clupeoides]